MPVETCARCGSLLFGEPEEPCTSCMASAALAAPLRVATRRAVPAHRGAAVTRPRPTEALAAAGREGMARGFRGALGEGIVLQMAGPHLTEGRRDRWRAASVLLLLGLLLPLALAVWIALFVLRLALSLVGLRSGGGQGLFSEIIAFHLFGSAARRPERIPVYDFVLETADGLLQARQEGEFTEGRIFVGNRVRLDGRLRAGVLIIGGGENLTLGTSLALPVSPWRSVFLLLVLLVLGAGAAALAWAPALGSLR